MLRNCVEYKRFVWELNNFINVKNNINTKIIFLCLGTNMIVGDAFGPVVGTVLKKVCSENNKVEIIGDLENVVTYNKIKKSMDYINLKYSNSLIIVLDSALSSKKNIGKIFVQNRGLKYAESLKKQNSMIGNISIKAVVGENSENNLENFKNLKYVPINQIETMCNLVSIGIIDVLNKKENNGKNIYK